MCHNKVRLPPHRLCNDLGGGIEGDEDPADALAEVARLEAGIVPVPGNIAGSPPIKKALNVANCHWKVPSEKEVSRRWAGHSSASPEAAQTANCINLEYRFQHGSGTLTSITGLIR